MSGKCTVPWCHKDVYARGYCSAHYRRLMRVGEAISDKENRAYHQGRLDMLAEQAATEGNQK